MKKLYRRLAVTLALSTLFIAILFTISLYGRSKAESNHYLNQLLESEITNIENTVADQKEREEILKEDYLNRAWGVEYIVSHDFKNISRSNGLVLLKELMEVSNISVIDYSGTISLCTDDSTGKLYENQEELQTVLHSEEDKAYVFCVDRPQFSQRPAYFYVLVKSNSPYYAAIRIDADVSRLGLMSREELIQYTLRQATTEYDTSMLAVDQESGRILGITENNHQEFHMEGTQSQQDMLQFLDSMPTREPVLLKINDQYWQSVICRYEDIYLIASSSMDKVFGNMAQTLLEGLFGICIISLLTGLLVHYHIIRMQKELSLAKAEARYDKLTGLYNRNGFEQYAEQFLTQDQTAGALILFDLDNFKKINDFEGHPEGDQILKKFAQCLNACFRKSDCIGRLGGDEFVVLIPNLIPEEILVEKLENVLYEVRKMLNGYYEKYDTSVSIGAVPVDGTIKTYAGLYQCADAALYAAKYMGKNQYYINHGEIPYAQAKSKTNIRKEKQNREKSV
ncbi:GGDEF domain-containing protein [Ructibacterium gallinarum]|uniref:GGDEF domain-containing protein n=1 Tax=Ructibacterium gallinarum TaxID=2779355 RepID=A0A9D5RBL5_9FIRM|nr:GGDEF domain-containing protein [Ructibacterium gallinarum]MBE5040153.1 GGDEF domain-containing protein [Ructibacterium gallinarum]